MSSTMRSYASELARRSPSSPSVVRSTAHRCSSSPRFTYWPTVGSSSMTRIRMLLRAAGTLEAVFANLAVERLGADAERGGRATLMPVRIVQHGLDVAALELRERHGRRRGRAGGL